MTDVLSFAKEEKKSRFARWTPKKWHPFYTEVVALDAAGINREDISNKFGITKQHVTNIVNTPQAAILRRAIHNKMMNSVETSIEDNLTRAAVKASERIRDYIEDDERYKNNGASVVDRSFRALQAVGKIRSGSNESAPTIQNQSNMFVNRMTVMTAEAAKELAEALRLSAEVEKMYSLPVPIENVGT